MLLFVQLATTTSSNATMVSASMDGTRAMGGITVEIGAMNFAVSKQNLSNGMPYSFFGN